MPSLAQLDQAVREFIAENPKDSVTVVVDASFGHRIDPSEVLTFEEAEAAGEVVSPPAGAIGRGDAFLLRIAEKTGATVLSNDSFQEFHGEHPWLFDNGRLIGGKPVPDVGWIFMARSPVRGHKSREVLKEAKRRQRADAEPLAGAADAASRTKIRPKSVDRAIARATEEVVQPQAPKSRRRRGGSPPAEPVNEPLAFITFIAAHPLGSEVIGMVLEYSSHGAFVEADGARCYMPLSAMGSPAPRRAREAVSKGEQGVFVVQAFDPPRRGIELAMPGFATVSGSPTKETVEAEIGREGAAKRAGSSRRREKDRRSGARLLEPATPAGAVEAIAPTAAALALESKGSEEVSKKRPAKARRKAAASTASEPAGEPPAPAGKRGAAQTREKGEPPAALAMASEPAVGTEEAPLRRARRAKAVVPKPEPAVAPKPEPDDGKKSARPRRAVTKEPGQAAGAAGAIRKAAAEGKQPGKELAPRAPKKQPAAKKPRPKSTAAKGLAPAKRASKKATGSEEAARVASGQPRASREAGAGAELPPTKETPLKKAAGSTKKVASPAAPAKKSSGAKKTREAVKRPGAKKSPAKKLLS